MSKRKTWKRSNGKKKKNAVNRSRRKKYADLRKWACNKPQTISSALTTTTCSKRSGLHRKTSRPRRKSTI